MSTALPAFVDGATRLFGILGDPIVQAKSPEVFTGRFRAAVANAVMVPMHVRADDFDEVVRAIKRIVNLDGLIATIPHKSRILEHLDHVRPTGRRIGAVNAVRRERDGTWSGDMFDGKGCVAGMRSCDVDPKGRRVLLLGAGGAGSAIADALADAGAASITLFDRNPGKMAQLADRVSTAHPGCKCEPGDAVLRDHDVLINATPVGMYEEDGLPADFGIFSPDLFVVDIVPRTPNTRLLVKARAEGCKVMPGTTMVAGQVDAMVRFFFHQE